MGKTSRKTHEQFIEEMNIINPNINILGKYKNTKSHVECECKICGFKWSPNVGNLLHNKSGCPVCAGNKIVKGMNDLWTTHPEIAKLLKFKEDGYITSHACNSRKLWFICPTCNHEIYKHPSEVYYHGLACPRCSDGYSYPEKFLFEILKQLNINFETQKTFKWSPSRYYDFYLNDYNTLIEVHGMNHYKEGFVTVGGKTFEEEKANDIYKKELANENKISKYIIIDCRYSKLEWCKNSVLNSELKTLLQFNENDINWMSVGINSLKSRKIITCDLWNNGKSIPEIADELKVARNTIREYLKECSKYNLCNYDPKIAREKSKERCSKKVICLNNLKVYNSLSDVKRELGLSTSGLAKCCKGETKNCGKLPDGTKLYWKYYEDYLKSTTLSGVSA